MKSFESVSSEEAKPEYDEILEHLWQQYGFSGNPPRLNTEAEKRLKEKCEQYSRFIIDANHQHKSSKEIYSESNRRKLHNEIAVMTVGKQRSGMGLEEAKQIANFALTYTHGLTVDDLESGKFDDILNK